MGTILPLRGFASFAADLGIPGAATMLDILTPKMPRHINDKSQLTKAFNHRSRQGRQEAFKSQRRTSTIGYSPFRPEIHSLMGVAHGDRECMLKLACLSGKRLSSLSGASAVAILLASTTDFMPEAVREPYQAMKNSVMYSDDCSQYVCSKANPHQDL